MTDKTNATARPAIVTATEGSLPDSGESSGAAPVAPAAPDAGVPEEPSRTSAGFTEWVRYADALRAAYELVKGERAHWQDRCKSAEDEMAYQKQRAEAAEAQLAAERQRKPLLFAVTHDGQFNRNLFSSFYEADQFINDMNKTYPGEKREIVALFSREGEGSPGKR